MNHFAFRFTTVAKGLFFKKPMIKVTFSFLLWMVLMFATALNANVEEQRAARSTTRYKSSARPGPYQSGMASYYHNKYHGHITASGTVFSQDEMEAAHLTLPFGTLVRVTNLKNYRQVVVQITDRGPFVDGRIIDLSRKAALTIGMIKDGIVPALIQLETAAPGIFTVNMVIGVNFFLFSQ